MRGEFRELANLIEPIREIGDLLDSSDAKNCWAGQTLFAMIETGDQHEMLKLLNAHIEQNAKVLLFQAVPPWVEAELGLRERAQMHLRSLAESRFAGVPRDMNWLGILSFLAMAAAELRDRTNAMVLRELLSPFGDRFAVLGHATVTLGAVASHLARLSAVCGDWSEAAALFSRGQLLNARAGAMPWLARSHFDEGRERLRMGDANSARERFAESRQIATSLRMTNLVRRIDRTTMDLGLA
jgi:hypothetical protein